MGLIPAILIAAISIACPAVAMTNNDARLPQWAKEAMAEVDQLLHPMLKRPVVEVEILDTDEGDYQPGEARIRTAKSKLTLQHEYAHAYFDLNFMVLPGISLFDYLARLTKSLKEFGIKRRQITARMLNEGITPELKKLSEDIDKAQLQAVAAFEQAETFLEFNELWADFIPIVLAGDLDVMARELIHHALISDLDPKTKVGLIAHFHQRSFAGDARWVIQNSFSLSQRGYDPYSGVSAARYYLGGAIGPRMTWQQKTRLVAETYVSIQAAMDQIRESGKSVRQLSYEQLNRALIDYLESVSERKSTVSLRPEFIGEFSTAPPWLLRRILNQNCEEALGHQTAPGWR